MYSPHWPNKLWHSHPTVLASWGQILLETVCHASTVYCSCTVPWLCPKKSVGRVEWCRQAALRSISWHCPSWSGSRGVSFVPDGLPMVSAALLQVRVEWVTEVLFFEFRRLRRLSIMNIFRSSIPKNEQFRPRARVARETKFSFSNQQKPSLYFKEQSPKM